MALRFECDKCNVEVVPLFEAPNPVNGRTEQVMICLVCKERFAIQNVPPGVDPEAPPPVEGLIPEAAPDVIEIERTDLTPAEIRQSLLGRSS